MDDRRSKITDPPPELPDPPLVTPSYILSTMKVPDHDGVNGAKPETMVQETMIKRIIGGFGRYQMGLYVLLFLFKVFAAFHQMAIIFLAPKVSYVCGTNGTETCPCLDPEYNTEMYSNTITMEWNLICDRKWLISFSQTLLQLGVLLGSVLFGMAADRFGRKPPMLVAIIMQIVAGVAASFAPGYWIFTFLRFFVGMTVGGIMVMGFVILMEFIGKEYREVMTVLYQAPFAVGHMMLPLFGYFFRDFSDFQLAISISNVLLLSCFVVVLETPRWLLAVKKTDEAIHILERVAKVNKRPTSNIKDDIVACQAAIKENQLKKGNIIDLFRTSNLRKNIIAISVNWLACGYCYYGVSQYVGQLSGNVFINVTASASVSLIGCLAAIPLVRMMSRRTYLILFHFLSAGCLLILAVIPEGVCSVMLATIGVVCSFVVFMVLYLYCTELFPTVVRNAALGFSSMIARVGSMLAPFVIDLQSIAPWMPPAAFAILPLVAGCVTFLLPETKGCELMTTLEEGEQFKKKSNTVTKK